MKKLAAMLLCLSMLSAGALTAYAEEPNIAPGEATIGTEVPGSHRIIITVIGNVGFTVNGETGNEFEVERLSQPELVIIPYEGEKIVKVTLNGEDITEQLSDWTYTFPPIYEDGRYELVAETEKLPEDSSEPDSSTPDSSGGGTPPSNDNPNTGVIGGVSIGAGLVLAALVAVRRKSKENEE